MELVAAKDSSDDEPNKLSKKPQSHRVWEQKIDHKEGAHVGDCAVVKKEPTSSKKKPSPKKKNSEDA